MVAAEVIRKQVLILVRTPFQAWLAEKVIEAEQVDSYDLLYFTQDDSSEDRFYYDRLAAPACSAKFVFVNRQLRDFFNHVRLALKAWPFVLGKTYDATMISSIDSFVLNALANRSTAGELVTFDDGTANYNQGGLYFRDSVTLRVGLYRRLFGARSVNQMRAKIARHYTIHPDFENIVDSDRLLPIPGWASAMAGKKFEGSPKTYFIGAPFREALDSEQLDQLELKARNIATDCYVRHPREKEPLNLDLPFLEKRGKIAEEAILDDAGNRPIILAGFLSSVMFNLADRAQRRIVLVPSGSQRHASLIELARKSGCEIVPLEQAGGSQ